MTLAAYLQQVRDAIKAETSNMEFGRLAYGFMLYQLPHNLQVDVWNMVNRWTPLTCSDLYGLIFKIEEFLGVQDGSE